MIASVERAAQHRNGKGALPYISMFATTVEGRKLHALIFAEPGRIAVFDLDDPTQRLCAGTYEHDLRLAVAEIGLPIDGGDPLEVLHERAVQILGLVRQRRAAPSRRPASSAPNSAALVGTSTRPYTRSRAQSKGRPVIDFETHSGVPLDRDEMAARIKAGLDPAPKCPYLHEARARCPNCADWPRLDESYRDEIARLSQQLDVPPSTIIRSALNLKRKGLLHAEETYAAALGKEARVPLQTGVQIDDPDPLGVYVAPVVLRLVGRWVGALAMVVGAAAIMYAEGQRQPSPGVGFGIALGLLMGAALLLPLGRSNDG